MIKAIFIDFGGTLFDFCPTNYQLLGQVARDYGVEVEDTDPLLSIAFQRQEEYAMEIFSSRGEPSFSRLSEDEWVKLDEVLLNVVGVSAPGALEDIVDRFRKRDFRFQLYPETVKALHKLKGDGYKLGIISNLSGEKQISQRYSQLKEHGLLDMFDVITLSGEVGISKPSPGIFHRAIAMLEGVSASESLYVGDSYFFDVLGAEGAGMSSVLIDHNLGTDYNCLKIASFGDIVQIIDSLNGDSDEKLQ